MKDVPGEGLDLNFILLRPVKEEELRVTFGNARRLPAPADPDKLFAPTIAEFKKLAPGNYFWFIADPVHWRTHSAGGMLEEMTPMKLGEVVGQSPEIIFRHTHPEDLVHMFSFSNFWVKYFSELPLERKPHVKATMYIRLVTKDGTYKWMMVQYADTLLDADEKIHYGLTFVTDISHLKKNGPAMMSILDTYDDTCQQFVCVEGNNLQQEEKALPKLSKRELEVLRLLAMGNSSKQIAAALGIAIKTVGNHRQSLLFKTGKKSTGELVAYGITMGFI